MAMSVILHTIFYLLSDSIDNLVLITLEKYNESLNEDQSAAPFLVHTQISFSQWPLSLLLVTRHLTLIVTFVTFRFSFLKTYHSGRLPLPFGFTFMNYITNKGQ